MENSAKFSGPVHKIPRLTVAKLSKLAKYPPYGWVTLLVKWTLTRVWEGLYALQLWYAVVITCRKHHWSNCQREPVSHIVETMKLMAGLKALGCDL